jgi:hypothetical protein
MPARIDGAAEDLEGVVHVLHSHHHRIGHEEGAVEYDTTPTEFVGEQGIAPVTLGGEPVRSRAQARTNRNSRSRTGRRSASPHSMAAAAPWCRAWPRYGSCPVVKAERPTLKGSSKLMATVVSRLTVGQSVSAVGEGGDEKIDKVGDIGTVPRLGDRTLDERCVHERDRRRVGDHECEHPASWSSGRGCGAANR